MRRKLVIGNWKMHGKHQANAQLLEALLPALAESAGVETAVCPPYPYLAQVAELLAGSTLKLGAQNLSRFDQGAHTGEVSAHMLRELGCQYVLVGHSERRSLYGEDDRLVAEKFAAALCADLVPVLCVGESLAQRRGEITERVVAEQIQAVLQRVGINGLAGGVIAYEPVWAIGTGETATPAQVQAVHRHIRSLLAEQDPAVAAAMRILYGGSVKAANAGELFAQTDVDGGLIGGASLDAASFAAICAAAQR
ncbi:triosephosphate isomerase [Pseudomonas sp. SJZ079]|uniref:triose-phosphate isomerase n=1 Tax=Pseudomonas sp. SJZ079 TaxID=2572887 RepID=UPI001199B90B|nr:triose-phosphate isomerase [Pseudomonas sp. SJZ079]TWC28041.1 triosephosphate isomerase [Pseudomonas sp. SJZ079]